MFPKIIFSLKADRIGPDLPFTHFFIFFKLTRNFLCKKKFKSFGDGAEIRPYSFFDGCSNIKIGERTVIRPNCFIYAEVSDLHSGGEIDIESDVLIGNSCHIYSSNHNFENTNIPILEQGHRVLGNVKISTGAWIGSNSTILPGVRIGKNSVVGAGSVVTKNVPDYSVFAGNPARLIRILKNFS